MPVHPERLLLQPIVHLQTGVTAGYEVLSRFKEGTPEAVFEAARQDRTILELDETCIGAALALVKQVPADFYLSINVTAESLASPFIRQLVVANGNPRSRVIFELSEQTPIDLFATTDIIWTMRALGVRIALDDVWQQFGHSDAWALVSVLPDMLKIDGSLVHRIESHIGQQAMVRGLASMGVSLRCAVCAEGIETAQEKAWVERLGAHLGQGFLLGRPEPLEFWQEQWG
jgi:EAL domain-containing protein (putative c-di-GMP-specific phosphodiesterase class I)